MTDGIVQQVINKHFDLHVQYQLSCGNDGRYAIHQEIKNELITIKQELIENIKQKYKDAGHHVFLSELIGDNKI